MKTQIVFSSVYRVFRPALVEWAKSSNIKANIRVQAGIVVCELEMSYTDILLKDLFDAVHTPLKDRSFSAISLFDQAIFPPSEEGGKPTILRGNYGRQETIELRKLPMIASRPYMLCRKFKPPA